MTDDLHVGVGAAELAVHGPLDLPGELEAEVRPGEGRLGLVKGNHLPEVELRDAWSGPEQHGLAVRGGGNGEPVGTSSAGGR